MTTKAKIKKEIESLMKKENCEVNLTSNKIVLKNLLAEAKTTKEGLEVENINTIQTDLENSNFDREYNKFDREYNKFDREYNKFDREYNKFDREGS
jgi:hypothetical protein